MNEVAKTGMFLGGSALLVVMAAMSGPKAVSNELFSDQGEIFFPRFVDPDAATELEVQRDATLVERDVVDRHLVERPLEGAPVAA